MNTVLDYKAAEEVIDKCFKHFPDYDVFPLPEIIKLADLSPNPSSDQAPFQNHIRRNYAQMNEAIERLLVKEFKYADLVGKMQYMKLTELGRTVKKAGGHYVYLQKNLVKESADKERQTLSDEKLKYDVANAKRINKTYWWTFFFAVVSFIYVLIQLILKVIEVIKPGSGK